MKPVDFRTIALSLEGVEEYDHAGFPAFRVGGRKFASLASQAEGYGNLQLTLEHQAAFVDEAPEIFLPIPGGWGRMAHTDRRTAHRMETARRPQYKDTSEKARDALAIRRRN